MRYIAFLFLFISSFIRAQDHWDFYQTIYTNQEEKIVHVMDIDSVSIDLRYFLPRNHKKDSSYPCIVFFYGGGWNNKFPNSFQRHARYFSSQGIVCVLGEYRVRDIHGTTPFDALKDTKSCIRKVIEKADDFGIDIDRLIIAGGSAGGHLTAASVFINGSNHPENKKIKIEPAALLLYNPVIDNGPGSYGYYRFKERYTEISPMHNIPKNPPTSLFILGTNDRLIPVSTGEKWKSESEKKGGSCELITYQDQGHAFFSVKFKYFRMTLWDTHKFLQKHGFLKNDPPFTREEQWPDWKKSAYERIEQHRKANLSVSIVDSSGNKVIGARVKVNQKSHEFKWGAAVSAKNFVGPNKNIYRRIFLKYFNKAGFQNVFKYKFKEKRAPLAEKALPWFQKNNIPMRGHCLIWPGFRHMHKSAEKYKDGSDPEGFRKYCEAQVIDYAKRWDVVEWDVVNENRGNTDVQQQLSDTVLIDWFKLAKQHVKNQGARLFLNENRVITAREGKTEQLMNPYYRSVKFLLDNDAPLTALGFQSRIRFDIAPDTIWKRLKIFEKFNLPMMATEFEVKDSKIKKFSPGEQATITEQMMTLYFSHPQVTDFMAWTLFKDEQNALFDLEGNPTPQGARWMYLVDSKWKTKERFVTKPENEITLRGFKGLYEIIVSKDGKKVVKEVFLSSDKAIEIILD